MGLKIEMHFVAQVSHLPTNSDWGILPLDIELHAICCMGSCPPRNFSLERLGCTVFVTWVSQSPTSWKLSCSKFSMHLICCIFFGAHPLREGAVFTFCFKICQISRWNGSGPEHSPNFGIFLGIYLLPKPPMIILFKKHGGYVWKLSIWIKCQYINKSQRPIVIKTMQNFIYKTHHGFGKCTKVLKTKGNLKDVKLAQMKCQKLLISPTNRL